MFQKRKTTSVLLIALLCITVSLTSSTLTAGTDSLSAAAENTTVGGSDCSDFLNGFAIGLGIGALFGCAFCPAGAVMAKAVELIAC